MSHFFNNFFVHDLIIPETRHIPLYEDPGPKWINRILETKFIMLFKKSCRFFVDYSVYILYTYNRLVKVCIL